MVGVLNIIYTQSVLGSVRAINPDTGTINNIILLMALLHLHPQQRACGIIIILSTGRLHRSQKEPDDPPQAGKEEQEA